MQAKELAVIVEKLEESHTVLGAMASNSAYTPRALHVERALSWQPTDNYRDDKVDRPRAIGVWILFSR